MSTKKNGNYPLIPDEEQKCVWMTTGFISYKLCDRNFQCESCPLDRAIKDRGGCDVEEIADDGTEKSVLGGVSVEVSGSIFYHPAHCWAKVENPEKVKLGIDDLLIQLLNDVKVVILPKVGSCTVQGECCAHVIQEEYILPVIAPLSGWIQSVNHRLKEKPTLVTDSPGQDGWLITIKPKNLQDELKSLLFGRDARVWYRKEEKAIIAQTEMILKHDEQSIGPTMQDGGVRIGCLRDMVDMVNSKQRARILDLSIERNRDSNKRLTK